MLGFLHVRDLLGVTLEDLVEELVGEIRDEYDVPDDVPTADPSSLDGATTLEEFARATGIELEDGGMLEVAAVVGSRITQLTLEPDPSALVEHPPGATG